MMLTAKLNHVLSFYPDNMFIPTSLGHALRARITSDVGVLRPHQINFMDDGFSVEKNGASERIFFF